MIYMVWCEREKRERKNSRNWIILSLGPSCLIVYLSNQFLEERGLFWGFWDMQEDVFSRTSIGFCTIGIFPAALALYPKSGEGWRGEGGK